ncbi:MAG TPA: hypothetical protein VM619_03425 [Luteimonas sp.]|nr:hypothetical protein [Luteimonas sp.]
MLQKILRHCSLAILLGLAALSWSPAWAADVWVNTSSGVYHCPGAQYYGNTKRGTYLSESEAVSRGYRAAYNRPCSASTVDHARTQLIQSLTPAGAASDDKVWINTGSHVYHCPGTRYYGATKRGYFATEAEAISSGNRPAYGTRCN